ncbi:MAG: DUF3179 domain-containing protein [Acidobacteria bacterium]|nr:DUF3179 domain-containing protein [Acidobacteriota bacterium]
MLTRMVVCVGVLAVLSSVLGTISRAQETSTERRLSWKDGPLDRSDYTRLNKDGYPLNLNPEIVSPQDAPLREGDLVMGAVINGEARAYPVNYMNGPTNEIVNDTLGGKAIAPSW